MATKREEMVRLIAKMSDTVEATRWLKARNDELKLCLQHISVGAVRYDTVGGRTGPGDPVSDKVVKREDIEMEIRINERAISDRLSHHALLSLVMAETLTEDERKVIWARHGEKLPWERVARAANKARTACFKLEREGMAKLCAAWDCYAARRTQEEKNEKKENSKS